MYDKLIILAVGGVVAIGTVLYYLYVDKEKPQKHRSKGGSRNDSSHFTSYSDIKTSPCRKRKPTSGHQGSNNLDLSENTKREPQHTVSEIDYHEGYSPSLATSDPAVKHLPPNQICNVAPEDQGSNLDAHGDVEEDLGTINCSETDKESAHESKSQSSHLNDQSVTFEPNKESSDLNSDVLVESKSGSQEMNLQKPSQEGTVSASPPVCRNCDKPANARFYPCKHRELCSEHAQYYFDFVRQYNRTVKCPAPNCKKELIFFSCASK